MNNGHVARHNKKRLILCVLITAAVLMIILNCSSSKLIQKKMLPNETFPPQKTLPIILREWVDAGNYNPNKFPVGWRIIGQIQFVGSKQAALKQAAKLGAEGVALYTDKYYYKGYHVVLYRKLYKHAKKPDPTEIWIDWRR